MSFPPFDNARAPYATQDSSKSYRHVHCASKTWHGFRAMCFSGPLTAKCAFKKHKNKELLCLPSVLFNGCFWCGQPILVVITRERMAGNLRNNKQSHGIRSGDRVGNKAGHYR